MLHQEIELSFIQSYPNLERALLDNFDISKNLIKKYLSRKYLNRKVREREKFKLPIDILNAGMINPRYEGPKVEVVYDDDKILGIFKPEKIHTHPLKYSEKSNTLSFLRESSLVDLNVNFQNYDRGLLYRLDYETSGLLIYIKNANEHKSLRDNFSQLVKKKVYRAWVHGVDIPEGKHVSFLRPCGSKNHKMIYDPKGVPAELELKILKDDSCRSLVEIILKTGLRHQIRAQLSHLGFPIVGDPLYGKEADSHFRLMLHAWRYAFSLDGDGSNYEYKIDCPCEHFT